MKQKQFVVGAKFKPEKKYARLRTVTCVCESGKVYATPKINEPFNIRSEYAKGCILISTPKHTSLSDLLWKDVKRLFQGRTGKTVAPKSGLRSGGFIK